MKYKFIAIDAEGKRYEATQEAASKLALYQDVRKTGATIVTALEVKDHPRFQFLKNFSFRSKAIKPAERIHFAKNLAAMIEAGLPLTRALSVVERQAKRKIFKETINRLAAEINKGTSLNQALEQFPQSFSPLFVSMVRAGEESGSLVRSLKGVADQLEKSYLLKKKIKGAMIYPIIILSIMVVIGVLMLIYLVPVITATFKELKLDLPLSTRFFIATSDFLKDNTLLSLVIVITIGGACTYFYRTRLGERFFGYIFLRIPIIGTIVKETNSAHTTRTLSSLLSSGVQFLNAIKITEGVIQNSYYKSVLSQAAIVVEKGGTIANVFEQNTDLYPVFVSEMVAIGEETGKLSEMLENVATFYENEVDQKTKDLSTVVEPFLMVIIGIAVGFFAISMLSPTYSLVDAL